METALWKEKTDDAEEAGGQIHTIHLIYIKLQKNKNKETTFQNPLM